MKTPFLSPMLLTAYLCFAMIPPLAAADVGPGDDRETVLDTLGDPNGRIGSDTFEILHYPRGEVVLRNGVVERANLVSAQEMAARIEREAARQAAREREREEAIARGEALRDEKLADETFMERSPRERLAFWQTFRRHYPEVDIGFELDVVRREVEESERVRRDEERREERLLAMERRIREAERRAEEAESEARRLEEEQRRQRQYPRHIHSTYIIHPETKKPEDSESDPSATPRPRERRIHGEPEREPNAFERAREYRHERAQRRNETRYRSN